MPATSHKQKRFFQIIRAVQEGKFKNPSKDLLQKAKAISKKDAHDFASKPIKPMSKEKVAEMIKAAVDAANNHISQYIP